MLASADMGAEGIHYPIWAAVLGLVFLLAESWSVPYMAGAIYTRSGGKRFKLLGLLGAIFFIIVRACFFTVMATWCIYPFFQSIITDDTTNIFIVVMLIMIVKESFTVYKIYSPPKKIKPNNLIEILAAFININVLCFSMNVLAHYFFKKHLDIDIHNISQAWTMGMVFLIFMFTFFIPLRLIFVYGDWEAAIKPWQKLLYFVSFFVSFFSMFI